MTDTDDGILRQPAALETEDDRVWFRTGNDTLPTHVFVIWDGGDRVSIHVATHRDPDGMAVLITLDDARRMRHALQAIELRADEQEDA
jgi:hypothetical protein